MDALLQNIVRTNRNGRCDPALFALMFNTGARALDIEHPRVKRRGSTLRRHCLVVRLVGGTCEALI
jgi:hypothetical protein